MITTYDPIAVPTWDELVSRLENEHADFIEKLSQIYRMGARIQSEKEPEQAYRSLLVLQERVSSLLEQLDQHASWEEVELFPILTGHFGMQNNPTLLPSIWVAEKAYELAKQYMKKFIEIVWELNRIPIVGKGQILEALSCLSIARRTLLEHFAMEEELVVPLLKNKEHLVHA